MPTINGESFARENVSCALCLVVCPDPRALQQHLRGLLHKKLYVRQQAEARFLEEWERLAQANQLVATRYHCQSCHFVTTDQSAFTRHQGTRGHQTQQARATRYAAFRPNGPSPVPKEVVVSEVDLGIIDSAANAPLIAQRHLNFTNESSDPRILIDVRPVTVRTNPPFEVRVNLPANIPPLQVLSFVTSFNRQGLSPGYYIEERVFEFSAPAICMYLTLRATLGNATLLNKLVPTAKYIPRERATHDRFEDRGVERGFRPQNSRRFLVFLGANEIPQNLLDLFRMPLRKQLTQPPLSTLRLTDATYRIFFSTLIHAEEYQNNEDIRAFDLLGVPFRRHIPPRTRRPGDREPDSFIITVPGLAEKRPSVLPGDRVKVMAAGAVPQWAWEDPSTWAWEGFAITVLQSDVVIGGFSGHFRRQWTPTRLWDVRFTLNRTPFRAMHDAIKRVSGGSDRESQGWQQRLFPMRPNNERPEEKLRLIKETKRALRLQNNDIMTNMEQLRAVAMVVSGVHEQAPFLLFGPPGTGKTSTMIECIYQVLRHPAQANKPIRVLATAPSNAAADLLLQRLTKHFNPKEMLRMNSPNRSVPLINESLLPYCMPNRNGKPMWITPSIDQLQPFKIIVCTLGAMGILYRIGGPWLKFSHLFVDEAGQALEPEVMVAMQFMAKNPDGRVILGGDPCQLGPIVNSPTAKHFNYHVSFLERLVTTADNVPNRRGCYSVADDAEEFSDLYGVLLRNNYRSHASILEPPNELFYRSQLIAVGNHDHTHSLIYHPILPAKGFPMFFKQVNGKDLREGDSPSWFNPLEVTAVVDIIRQLLSERGKLQVKAEEIGVIAPYRKQVQKLRTGLEMIGAAAVQVGTTELFQGTERRVIIVSTVRATEELIAFDQRHSLGFVGDPKRFNVATTRARALCCVVGDARVLKTDRSWRRWMQYVKQRGGWDGPMVDIELEVENSDDGDDDDDDDGGMGGLIDGVHDMNVGEEVDGWGDGWGKGGGWGNEEMTEPQWGGEGDDEQVVSNWDC